MTAPKGTSMFKTADFKVYRPMFAVNPYAVSVGDRNRSDVTHTCVVAAVWFRRKHDVTYASAGYLHRSVEGTAPADAQDFLSRPALYPHRADCVARWDGRTLWCLQDEETRARYLDLLRPMLAAVGTVPDGWSGWWWNG
jgi:predicted protein tyrosine phosphatase